MVYYTLAVKGQEWFISGANPPRSNLKTLRALAEMLAENNVPRTSDQIAHELGLQPKTIEAALIALTKEDYVQLGHLPQPIEKSETPKPRIKPIEDIVASEIRAQEARKRYDQSEKGQIAHYIFEHSEKGRIKNQRYWTNRGRLIQKAYRIRRDITSMTTTGADSKLIEDEKAKLTKVEDQLKREE